jgi:alpha-beta hydrolase superfamily lysophospholipase
MSVYQKLIPSSSTGTAIRSESMFWLWNSLRVHVLNVGRPDAPVRMVMLHGAGGNAAAMQPFAERLAELGAYVSVPDLPGYGLTEVPDRSSVTYEQWHLLTVDMLTSIKDSRPLVVLGASIGGVLAYDAVAVSGAADALVVTCLLDPREAAFRERLSWSPVLGRYAGSLLRWFAGPLKKMRVPIRLVADMGNISNSPALTRAVVRDRRGGGVWMPLGWMRSFLEWTVRVEPESFAAVPVLMVHPGEDRWTPLEISQPFFDRIAAPKELVVLEGAGHFPIEQPGLDQMVGAVGSLIERFRKTDSHTE